MTPMWFDGGTYSPTLDEARLMTLLDQVFLLMRDRERRTLHEIHKALHYRGSEASISARLRDLRKPRFGEYFVGHKRRAGHDGLWEYWLNPELGSGVPPFAHAPLHQAAFQF